MDHDAIDRRLSACAARFAEMHAEITDMIDSLRADVANAVMVGPGDPGGSHTGTPAGPSPTASRPASVNPMDGAVYRGVRMDGEAPVRIVRPGRDTNDGHHTTGDTGNG